MVIARIKEKALNLWLNLSEKARKEIVSFIHTFVAAFGVFVVDNFHTVAFTKEALWAFVLSAVRTSLKLAYNAWRDSRLQQP